jgi:hypothetical protein
MVALETIMLGHKIIIILGHDDPGIIMLVMLTRATCNRKQIQSTTHVTYTMGCILGHNVIKTQIFKTTNQLVNSTKVANSTKVDATIKGHVTKATTTMVVPATRTSIISIKTIRITRWFHTIPVLLEGHKVSIEMSIGIMGRICRMHITCKTMALLTDFPVVHQSSEECLLRQL